MTRSKDKSEKQDAEHAEVGEKHQTDKESPQSKRAKTETEKRETRSDTAKKSQKSEPQKSERQEGKAAPSSQPAAANGGAEKPGKEPDVPTNILEKGIIYFFIRGRVGIDDPSSVDDIRRSHILLRPIANDAKLGEGPIADAGNSRLVALPKKVLPLSGKDRFIAFVEKSAASFKTIKETYLAGSEYTTKTAGTRHNPPAKPEGEGVYAITTTGRESHLAYMLTIPEKLEEVQQELGLREKGSFIISTKNPNIKGPPNVQFKDKPDFPKEIMDEFGSYRWLPTRPAHLDYPNTQLLLIGESSGIEKATRKQEEDEKEGKEDPEEALEELEEEDLKRMRHLPGDQSASIYADLKVHAEDCPKLQTTFD